MNDEGGQEMMGEHRDAARSVAREVVRLASEDLLQMGMAYVATLDSVEIGDEDALERCVALGQEAGISLLFLARWTDALAIDVDADDDEMVEALGILRSLPLRSLADSCVLLGGVHDVAQVDALPLWDADEADRYFMGNEFAEVLSAARVYLYGAPVLPDLQLLVDA